MTVGSNSSGHLFDTSFTTDGALYSAASGVVTSTAGGTTGQFLGANTSAAPTWKTPVTGTTTYLSVYLHTSVSNVTGDGTIYPVVFDTVISDTASGYNSGTGVYTIPATGNYILMSTLTVAAGSTSTQTTVNVFINGTEVWQSSADWAASNLYTWSCPSINTFLSLNLNDTVAIRVACLSGSKTTIIYGSDTFNNRSTFFNLIKI